MVGCSFLIFPENSKFRNEDTKQTSRVNCQFGMRKPTRLYFEKFRDFFEYFMPCFMSRGYSKATPLWLKSGKRYGSVTLVLIYLYIELM